MKRWIEIFANHRIAANGVMILLLLSGLWAVTLINNQFFPDFTTDRIRVSATWPGVSSEDMYSAAGEPLQQALLTLPEVKEIDTTARDNTVSFFIKLSDHAKDLTSASEAIELALATVTLPSDVEDPIVTTPQERENIADLLVYGDVPRDELVDLAYRMQSELHNAGFVEVNLLGVPSQQIDIHIPMERLLDTGLTLSQVANTIAAEFTTQPAGNTSSQSMTLALRSQTPEIDFASLQQLVVAGLGDGSDLQLGDIAEIERVISRNANELFYQQLPAIGLQLLRTPGEDTLERAEALQSWLEEFEQTLPSTIKLHSYNETWQIVSAQLSMLIKNGAFGMILVMLMLFLFLNNRLAFWVAVGIPTCFMATFLFLAQTGGSLNTISLLGFIIALGIIVDDAIVVSEQTRTYQQAGMNANLAALSAAKKMWPPVLASSLTTVAAFLPLVLIGGEIGALAKDIPIVVTFAIIASLIECFLILPAHLSHSKPRPDSALRQRLDNRFNTLRDHYFRPLLRWALANRMKLTGFIIVNLFITLGLVVSSTVPFQLTPAVEAPSISVSVEFADGTEPAKVDQFVDHLTAQLQTVEDQTGFDFIKTALVTRNQNNQPNLARIDVELISDQDRPYTNQELVNEWRAVTQLPSEIVSINFGRGRLWGDESGDIQLSLTGNNIDQIKAAALSLSNRLDSVPGLSDSVDNLPYGDEQLQFELTPLAREVGISDAALASFIREQLNGVSATQQITGLQTIELIVALPERQRRELTDLLSLPYRLPSGELVPLQDLIVSHYQRGLDSISAENGVISALVSATLDANIMTSDEMFQLLENDVLPAFRAQHGTLSIELDGDAREQDEFFADMILILLAVIALIYGILAWVFESWLWPIAILATVPFGLIGAIYGHWLIGLPLSALSMIGLFGLSGIVINDSIVLVTVYRELRSKGTAVLAALEDAVASRLRPVLLTTLTTIAGLTPLLFETSLDVEFLKPIAAGLVFGLLFATVLILLLIPVLLLSIENSLERLQRLQVRWARS